MIQATLEDAQAELAVEVATHHRQGDLDRERTLPQPLGLRSEQR